MYLYYFFYLMAIKDDNIKKNAVIFKKSVNRPLSNYQLKINEAAIDVALESPSILCNRGQLLEKARSKVIEDGYAFVKGKSRSKYTIDASIPGTSANKRAHFDEKVRSNRILELMEDIRYMIDG